MNFQKLNNFEWLRLVFALQVVVVHVSEHLHFQIPSLIRHFPGVPAFFFVSGFLIYASYLNAPGVRYFQNRILRLYPGLFFVTLGGMGVALVAHGVDDILINFKIYATWFVAQLTIGQAYNPALFRDIGIGVLNGSLWTITTEILFYLTVPIIVWMEKRFHFAVPVLIVFSFVIYAIGPELWTEKIYREKTFYDILGLTPIVWGWMFGIGILAVKYFEFVKRWLKYFPFALIPMIAMIIGGRGLFWESSGNRVGLIYFCCYICLVLWLSFKPKFVRLNFDLSYGTYIWHAPVINLLLILSVPSASLAILLTLAFALLSWFLVEKPALRLKRRSLKPV